MYDFALVTPQSFYLPRAFPSRVSFQCFDAVPRFVCVVGAVMISGKNRASRPRKSPRKTSEKRRASTVSTAAGRSDSSVFVCFRLSTKPLLSEYMQPRLAGTPEGRSTAIAGWERWPFECCVATDDAKSARVCVGHPSDEFTIRDNVWARGAARTDPPSLDDMYGGNDARTKAWLVRNRGRERGMRQSSCRTLRAIRLCLFWSLCALFWECSRGWVG